MDGVARRVAVCLLAATAFNLLFFTLYGPQQSLFLYAPNCTFFVVAWAAISLEPMVTRGGPLSRALVIALCGLVVLEAITNIHFVYSVYSVYR